MMLNKIQTWKAYSPLLKMRVNLLVGEKIVIQGISQFSGSNLCRLTIQVCIYKLYLALILFCYAHPNVLIES